MKLLLIVTFALSSLTSFASDPYAPGENAKMIYLYGTSAKTAYDLLATENKIEKSSKYDGKAIVYSVKTDFMECEHVSPAPGENTRLLERRKAFGYECELAIHSNGQAADSSRFNRDE